MKVSHYVLTDAEHTQQLEPQTITLIEDGKPRTNTVPAAFQIIDKDALTYEQRCEAMAIAGLDKYQGGVAFGRITKPWRGHAAGSFAIRHLNSSGYHVHVFELPVAAAAKEIDAELAQLQADQDLARLEAERKAQREKDEQAANDNKEGAPPAPADKVEPPAA